MKQIELHNKIDTFVNAGAAKAAVAEIHPVVVANPDARRYFYSRIDGTWFDWLRQNGALDVVKHKSEDPTHYSYRTPELNYLARVVEQVPDKVADFILTVPVSKETFNPEVVDRFLWTASNMPAKDLARIVPKIRDEQWVRLMGPFNRWGFEYKRMFEKLAEAHDQDSIITLAQAVLLVRTKEEFKKTRSGISDNPFFLEDLHHTEVFEHLAGVDDEHVGAALSVAARTLGDVVKTGEKEDKVFEIGETFHLFDVDFFSLEVGDRKRYSFKDDVRDLAAAVKVLVGRAIKNTGDNEGSIRKIYEEKIAPLPPSRTIWRLSLYVWSLRPEAFRQELRLAFFRAFESKESLWPITGGAEYERALKAGFRVLSETDRGEYIRQALEKLVSEENRAYGHGIFSSIYSYLSKPQIDLIEKAYSIPLKPDYEPEPSIMREYASTVVPQTPPETENVWAGPVSAIAETIKTQWSPEQLHAIDGDRDFARPINAEGVGDKMRAQMKVRMKEYTQNALLFFDRRHIDPHYTYSFLRGVQEAIRANRDIAMEVDWEALTALGKAIAAEGKREPFDFSKRERERFDAWLVGWSAVHSSLADVFQECLRNESRTPVEFFVLHRDDLFDIVTYLLSTPDPSPADEKIETAGMKSKRGGEDEYLVSDPLTIAINSTRGRAYELLVFFADWDGRKYPKDAKSKLSPDVLRVYENLLRRENTGAIMFLYGHYLAFFYYRDVSTIQKLLPQIFTHEAGKEHLYLAAWEGYLTRSLYRELYDQLQGEYEYAIGLGSQTYPKRNYRADLDDALATHLALAYMHFEDFTLESKLFKLFWDTPNKKRHEEFVSFIGRHLISRERPKEFLKEHPEVHLEKLMQFWDWALENCSDQDVLAEFGYWMNLVDGPYEDTDVPALAQRIRATLQKSDGRVDWELRFVDSLPILADKAPADTVKMLRLYFSKLDTSPRERGVLHIDADLVDVFRQLYNNPTTKDATYQLVDELLPLGDGVFWQLKKALE